MLPSPALLRQLTLTVGLAVVALCGAAPAHACSCGWGWDAALRDGVPINARLPMIWSSRHYCRDEAPDGRSTWRLSRGGKELGVTVETLFATPEQEVVLVTPMAPLSALTTYRLEAVDPEGANESFVGTVFTTGPGSAHPGAPDVQITDATYRFGAATSSCGDSSYYAVDVDLELQALVEYESAEDVRFTTGVMRQFDTADGMTVGDAPYCVACPGKLRMEQARWWRARAYGADGIPGSWSAPIQNGFEEVEPFHIDATSSELVGFFGCQATAAQDGAPFVALPLLPLRRRSSR